MIRDPIPWPNGAKCACAITFDMDADSLIHIARPQDSANLLYPISMGRYGPEVAIPRILETYRRLGLQQSFFIPGWCIEQFPAAVDAILEGGHEIGHHGYLHEDPCAASKAEQAHWLDFGVEIIQGATGRKPRGYRAPLYNLSADLPAMLAERGFVYDSSLMGDDIPYVLDTDAGELYEMPVHWGTDDWPPFVHYAEIGYHMPVRGPRAGQEGFWEEFEAAYDSGGFWIAIWHPFVTGRLARWKAVERWLEDTLENRDVWFAPLEEIAAHIQGLRKDGTYSPRIDSVPYYEGPVHL